jgi:hypothetical protein
MGHVPLMFLKGKSAASIDLSSKIIDKRVFCRQNIELFPGQVGFSFGSGKEART